MEREQTIEMMSEPNRYQCCPQHHPTTLRRVEQENVIQCDLCQRSIAAMRIVYECRTCDWDACELCMERVSYPLSSIFRHKKENSKRRGSSFVPPVTPYHSPNQNHNNSSSWSSTTTQGKVSQNSYDSPSFSPTSAVTIPQESPLTYFPSSPVPTTSPTTYYSTPPSSNDRSSRDIYQNTTNNNDNNNYGSYGYASPTIPVAPSIVLHEESLRQCPSTSPTSSSTMSSSRLSPPSFLVPPDLHSIQTASTSRMTSSPKQSPPIAVLSFPQLPPPAIQKFLLVRVPPNVPAGTKLSIPVPEIPGLVVDTIVPPNVSEFQVAYSLPPSSQLPPRTTSPGTGVTEHAIPTTTAVAAAGCNHPPMTSQSSPQPWQQPHHDHHNRDDVNHGERDCLIDQYHNDKLLQQLQTQLDKVRKEKKQQERTNGWKRFLPKKK